MSEHLSLFVKLLLAVGGIDSRLPFAVADLHLAEALLERGGLVHKPGQYLLFLLVLGTNTIQDQCLTACTRISARRVAGVMNKAEW